MVSASGLVKLGSNEFVPDDPENCLSEVENQSVR